MYKRLILLFIALLLVSACSSADGPAPTEQVAPTPTEKPAPTPTVEATPTPEPEEYDLSATIPLGDSGYTIPYPASWFAEVVDNQLTISDSLAQLDEPFTQPPLEGYSIDFAYTPMDMFVTFGMPEDPGLQVLMETAVDFYNVTEPTDVVETTLLGVPAIRARSRMSLEPEPEHPIEATTGILDDRIFFLVLHATNDEELEKFLPTWRQMVEGIQPAEVGGDEAGGTGDEAASADWEMVTSDGDNVCADGTPSAFWVRPGDEDKLFVYFQGPYHNTFCLDAENCELDKAFPWIDGAIHLSEEFDQPALADNFADNPERWAGVLDLSDPDNPLGEYTAVYIPYCTGDLFMGDTTRTYTRDDGTTFDIHHQGYANAQEVLNIVNENITAPERILLAGCEGGAPGALLQAPSIIEQYPEALVVQLSEGFAGVFPEAIDFDAAWGVGGNLPEALSGLPDPFTVAELTAAMAQAYPEARFAQFNYAEDGVQATAYSTGGLPGYSGLDIAYEEFASELTAALEEIHGAAPNFHSFTLQGAREQEPCALHSSLLYWLKGGDTYYIDWLRALLAGEEVPNVNGEHGFEAR